MNRTTLHKVLPFTTPAGVVVPGHEVARHQPDWISSPVEKVVFSTFNRAAQMTVETLVHWTQASQFMKCLWPSSGEIVAVLLEDGTRIHAKSWSLRHTDSSYDAAPIVARDTFKITTLPGTCRLWEVVGVTEWANSQRTPEDTAHFLGCPWARDNAAYAAMQLAAETQP